MSVLTIQSIECLNFCEPAKPSNKKSLVGNIHIYEIKNNAKLLKVP
jgi:hypothetical protein